MHQRDRRDGRTDTGRQQSPRLRIASRDKNCTLCITYSRINVRGQLSFICFIYLILFTQHSTFSFLFVFRCRASARNACRARYCFASSVCLSFQCRYCIGYSKEKLKIHTGVPSLPYPSLPFFPFPYLPFPSLPISPSLRSRAP